MWFVGCKILPLKLICTYNTVFKPHIDAGADDYSFIRGLGSYTGGELVVLDIEMMCLHIIDIADGWYYIPGKSSINDIELPPGLI